MDYLLGWIMVPRKRHGFDYNDKASVDAQFEKIKAVVMKLKNHPALIIWAIGKREIFNYEAVES